MKELSSALTCDLYSEKYRKKKLAFFWQSKAFLCGAATPVDTPVRERQTDNIAATSAGVTAENMTAQLIRLNHFCTKHVAGLPNLIPCLTFFRRCAQRIKEAGRFANEVVARKARQLPCLKPQRKIGQV